MSSVFWRARGRDIWSQFLIEAVFLTFAGGIIGAILGWVVSFVIDRMGLMTIVVTADIVILPVSPPSIFKSLTVSDCGQMASTIPRIRVASSPSLRRGFAIF